jgi:Na+-translocating ferredoxin:NAD+ oxidoreductase RnfE subunit
VTQETDANTQSNLSNRGDTFILDQVYLFPCSLNSSSLKLLITALKFIISCMCPPGLFLSLGLLIRLKSPVKSQSTLSGMSTL